MNTSARDHDFIHRTDPPSSRIAMTRRTQMSISLDAMGTGVRIFVVSSDGTVHRWSYKRFERVFDGREPVGEFAGKRLQYAMVFVDLDQRRPVGVRYAEWRVLRLGESGRHNPRAALRAAVDAFSPPPLPQSIVDARRRFNRRATSWTPNSKLKAAILDAALR
jgi:hypothetical protein